MLRAALAFFVLAIVAYIFGAYGIVGISMDIGKVLVGVFLVLAALSYGGSWINGRSTHRIP